MWLVLLGSEKSASAPVHLGVLPPNAPMEICRRPALLVYQFMPSSGPMLREFGNDSAGHKSSSNLQLQNPRYFCRGLVLEPAHASDTPRATRMYIL
jgi:hypothetical protein